MNKFKTIVTTGLMIALLAATAQVFVVEAAVTFKVVQTPAVSVYTSQGASDTTLTVTPVPADLDDNVLTMSNFGSNPTITVDPGVAGIEEIESFSTIVNNGNGTATLGGMTRDLQSVYPYTSVGAGRQHGGGAIVVFSNNPQVYGRLGVLENDQLWTGLNTYSAANKPKYNSTPTFGGSDGLAFVNYATLIATAIQGAGTSTEGSMGIVQLATFGQVGTGIASSSTGAPFVITNKFASSTYNGSTVFQGEIPTLRSTKNIDPNFIATSTADIYNFGGQIYFNGKFLSTASSTFTATTTFNGSNVLNNAIIFNGVPYAFPSTQGVAGTTFVNDGNGNLTNGYPAKYTTSGSFAVGSGAYATSSPINIPAGVLNASSTITVFGNSQCNNATSQSCNYYLRTTTGTTFDLCLPTPPGATTYNQTFQFSLVNTTGVSAQRIVHNCVSYNSSGVANLDVNTNTTAINLAAATGFVFVVQTTGASSISAVNFTMVIQP